MADIPQSRTEEILYATINGEEYTGLPESRIEELLLELKEVIESGGGGGAVSSVNGKTGDVTLDAEDVGALPDDTAIPSKTSDLNNDSGFITKTVNDLINYYLKSELYTKIEVDAKIAAIPKMHFEPVLVLPTEDIDTTAIYLVPKSISQSYNTKDEYINIDGTTAGWELIGDTEIDLSDYVTTTMLNTALADYVTSTGLATILADYATTSAMNTALAGKADSTDVTNKTNLKLASSGITASGEIRFGVDGQGNYGYIKAGADSVTPFKNPTGTKSISITENGTITEDVEDYANVTVIVNVVSDYEKKIRKTWNGLTNFNGQYIWTDGDNIYYSAGDNQYVLDKSTLTWNAKTWSGLSSFYGDGIWTDGDNIYWSSNNNQYVLDKSTSTWSVKTWSGLSSFNGGGIWTDGKNIYYSAAGTNNYVLDKSTSTWSEKTWSGLSSFAGSQIWTDGDNIYYSSYASQYVLNKSTSTWSVKTWNGLTGFQGDDTWTDGKNIYYSDGTNNNYVLDKSTSTWSVKTWNGYKYIQGKKIWTDGDNIYYSNYSQQYVLDKIVTGNTWYQKNLT